jgi:hypothetical protein
MNTRARCQCCDTIDPDGNSEGTLCRDCVFEMACDADADARERAIERAVDEHLDRARERRYG